MKKLSLYIFLVLMVCNTVYSEIFEMNQCYYRCTEKDCLTRNDTQWKIEHWDQISKGKKVTIDPITGERKYSDELYIMTEDVSLTIDLNAQTIFVTKILSDHYIQSGKDLAKYFTETEAGQKEKAASMKKTGDITVDGVLIMSIERHWEKKIRRLENMQKYNQKEYILISVTSGIVIGKRKKDFGFEKIFVDMNNGTYRTRLKFDGKEGLLPLGGSFICNNQESSSTQEANVSSGTAFFINNRGNLLTNNHVVDGCIQSKINYFDKEYDVQLIATDKNLDLALLKVDLEPKSYLNFSANIPKKLQKIYVAGYPFGKGLSDDLKISSGIVSSLKGLEDNSNELQVDAPINYGNSGGPIVGEKGELVAIAVSGLAKELTEGINFGIKSSAAANFLSVNEIQPSISKNNSINNDQLLKILEGSTVYTYCELKN